MLLAEAGYADGFELGMDCPNDRYVNDEKICLAVVGMLAKVGIKVNLLAQTRSKFFEKIQSRNTSFALMGWQPLTYDAHSPLQAVMSTSNEADGTGTYNVGGYSNPAIDLLTKAVAVEIDPDNRQQLISAAMLVHKHDFGHIPLHAQALAWGVKDNVDLVQRADDSFDLRWVMIK
jgi:peptide/nickel transport system substrate-binding protein